MNYVLGFLTSPTFGFVLKILSGIATAAFGILGIGTKGREDNGDLTPSGRTALIGILVSASIGGLSSIYDFVSGQKSADAAKQQSDQLLTSVRRGIYPLQGMTGSFRISIGDTFPDVGAYKSALQKEIAKPGRCRTIGDKTCQFIGSVDDPDSYNIPHSSELFPLRKTFPRLLDLLNNIQVEVWFYREVPLKDRKNGVRYKMLGALALPASSITTLSIDKTQKH